MTDTHFFAYADHQFDEFEKILGPDDRWTDEDVSIVFDQSLTFEQKILALRDMRQKTIHLVN